MPLFVWVALGVFLLSVAAGTTSLTVNAVRAWRHGWPIVRQLSAAAGELTPRVSRLEGRVVALEPRLAELQRNAASLAVSVARARLLLDVVLEAKRTLDFARAFVPRR